MDKHEFINYTKFLKNEVLKDLINDLILEDFEGVLIEFRFIEGYYNELKKAVEKGGKK